MKSPDFPLPDRDWEPTRGFFEAAARGELAIPRCAACTAFCWYPPERCPHCGGEELRWTRVSGRGSLFSWAVVQRALFEEYAEKAPYVAALVALEEDPAVRIVTQIVDCAPEDLRVDMPVEVAFRPLGFSHTEREVVVPFFTPAG